MATETAQAISTLYLELSGHYGLADFEDGVTPDWALELNMPGYASAGATQYFYDRSQSIYGTNEIQRNVIAKRVLSSEPNFLLLRSRRYCKHPYSALLKHITLGVTPNHQ